MKKIWIFVIVLILCLCSCTGQTNTFEQGVSETSAKDAILAEMESAFEKDSKKPIYMTTAGMIDLYQNYADKWDAVSAEYYDKILAVLDAHWATEKAGFVEKLDAMKADYYIYAEQELKTYDALCDLKYHGGSIRGPLYAAKQCALHKEYALKLVDFYEELRFDMEI